MGNYILADNQELTSFALQALVKQNEEDTVSRASNKITLIEKLKEDDSAVVLLDYTLFDFSDDEQLLIVSERFPHTSWILISEELTVQFLSRIIYGSHAFSIVFKDSPLKEIRDAIQYAARGERFLCQRVTEILLTQRIDDERPDVLTATETEILRAVARGRTTKEIAAERFSSIHTINTHKKNIFRKLKVNTAHEAIKYALRAGLVDPSEFYI